MEEFIFGTVAIDDLKLFHHRTSLSGVQHAYEITPRDPKPNEPIALSVITSPEWPADNVACYYTTDGSTPCGEHGVATNGGVIKLDPSLTNWDTYLWGYVTHWQGTIPPQPEGTVVRYKIGAWIGNGTETFADWPNVKATTDRAAGAFFRGKPLKKEWVGNNESGTIFRLHVDRLLPPQWARESVMYQIFLDRFNPGAGRGWIQTSNLKDFFGGTLLGITEKLDYISDLGVNCIWLSPVMPSPTTHRYDATDFYSVEPRLGGDEALRDLVSEAHSRNMRVVLDLVCNHISNHHPIFLEAQSDHTSRYRDWFHFDDPTVGYRSFFGVRSMPELNFSNEDARSWMFDIARFWLNEFDIDGYRLDHANGPGPGFWSEFRAVCKEIKPDSFCFGEIVEPASVLRRYEGRLDGTLDFLLTDAFRRTFGYKSKSKGEFEQFLWSHLSYFDSDFIRPTFVDNHDMDRFLFIAEGDKDALREVVMLQMMLPGPPIIYYGTEIGMSQTMSKSSDAGLEASRMAMEWGDQQDLDLKRYYQELIQERHNLKPWLLTIEELKNKVSESQLLFA